MVFFLGDFWHHIYRRGTIPVDLLNEMVRFFKDEWNVKTYMIPGNHDYHDSAETEHGLEMFKDIPCITVMDKPTIKDKLLFLPYMKDHEKIKEIVECPLAKEVVAIFGHLDVIGAKMNNSRLSTHGCSKDIFTSRSTN